MSGNDFDGQEAVDLDGDGGRSAAGDNVDRGVPRDGGDAVVYPPPAAPFAAACQLYGHYRHGNGLKTLLAWRGGWMGWRTTHWVEVDVAELRSFVYETLDRAVYEHMTKDGPELRPWNPDKRKVANVLEAMAAVGHLSAETDSPEWIALGASETAATQVISCTNGLLDLTTRQISGHTPALYNLVSVPFPYDAHAAEPAVWLEFLASVWGDDQDSIDLLQEYCGYVLSGRLDMQKMLLLIGPTRSGKGTIARILTELIGRLHVAGPTLASLGTNFGLSPLLGKPLAIISDARLGDTPTHTIVERLLSITGEDLMTVDRKYRDPWSGKLPTRFVILSNELPRFKDSSAAIANRMLILQMTQSFLGREDRTLDARLRGELSGILLWALAGLDRLQRNDRFTEPAASVDAATLIMDLASPMSAFVRDRCVRKPSASVPRDDLYAMWKAWCDENGHRPTAKATFGRDLRAVVPGLGDTRLNMHGHRIRCYTGIGLLQTIHNGPAPGQPGPHRQSAGQTSEDAQDHPGHRSDDVGLGGGPSNSGTGCGPGSDSTKSQVNEGGPASPGAAPLWDEYAEQPAEAKVCCDCGKELLAPDSIARRRCERCHLSRSRS